MRSHKVSLNVQIWLQIAKNALDLAREGIFFAIEHLFSGEIVPWKQRYIENNFRPPVIFRDITEFSAPRDNKSVSRTAQVSDLPCPRNIPNL